MCRAVSCRECGKTTWAGCGEHVDAVLKDVRPADRCPGHPKEPRTTGGGFFARLLRR